MKKLLFLSGILLGLISAVLMILNVLPLSARITVLIVGLGLIAITGQAKK